MLEDRGHDGRVLQGGNEAQPAAAARAGQHIDAEGPPAA
jgi:hypothetical protein